MRILILGTGAVGSLIGAKLALAGHTVVCIARPRVAQAIEQAGGLRLLEGGSSAIARVGIARTPDEALHEQPSDAVVFATKAYDVADALAQWRAVMQAGRPPVICMQNGVGSEQLVDEQLGPGPAIAGTLTTAVSSPEPGVVRVERQRGLGLALGHPLSRSLAAALAASGLTVRTYSDAAAMKWSKLLANIAANPISAITDMSAGEIFEHPGLSRLEVEAVREGVRVMRRMGLRPVDLPGIRIGLLGRAIFLPAGLIRPILGREVASARGAKMPSFHEDVLRRRGQSEVEWLNGAIAREGKRLGVPVPVNQTLTDVLTDLVQGRTAWETYRHNPAKLLERAGISRQVL